MTITIDEATPDDLSEILRLNTQIQAHHVALYPKDFHEVAESDAVRALFARLLVSRDQVVLLDSWAANQQAHDFFRSMGFAPIRVTLRRPSGVDH